MFSWKTPFDELVNYFYPQVDGMQYVVKLPNWNITTDDYQNKSGVITKYVTQYNDIIVPSDRVKKTYLRKNGKFWYTQYVEIELVPSVEESVWVCPYCGKRYNRNRRHKTEIIEHLKCEHRVGLSTYLKVHSEDADFLTFANQTYNLQLLNDNNRYVTCAICGKKLARIDWKHLNKHGLTKTEYVFKYNQETVSESTKQKLYKIKMKTNVSMKPLQVRIESFITRLKEIDKERNYDYSLIPQYYVNNRTKVPVIDRDKDKNGEEYGIFWSTPTNLLKGHGHPKKKWEKLHESVSFTQEEWIEKAKEIHKDENLDYSQVVYKGAHEKVYIIDNDINPYTGEIYGGYWQEANSHLRGHCHPLKGMKKQCEQRRLSTNEFVSRMQELYPDKHYDYSLVVYISRREKVKIVCPIHGVFEAIPDNLLVGKGCPVCGNSISKAEDEIYKLLVDRLGKFSVIKRDRTILSDQRELDIYIPTKRLAIEYNGLRWHTEQFGKDKYYHYNKMAECHKKGITLLQIFEDEYKLHKDIVLDKILHAAGLNNDKPNLMARKCTVSYIESGMAKDFLDTYHIQGYVRSTKDIGCFYNGKLVAVMSLTEEEKASNRWNLVRYATNYNYRCQGIASKLFAFFNRKEKPLEVKTFLDRRWEIIGKKNLYENLGFSVVAIERPDYMYTNGKGVRQHKFGFRKNVLHKKYGLPLTMTEHEMTKQLGYEKIWNCGLIKYVWRRHEEV